MIIDTNVYGVMVVDRSRAKDLLAHDTRIGIPLPVIAELRSGFVRGTRLVENELILTRLLAQHTTRILSPKLETTNMYAELQEYAKSRGRILSNNDVWIAALAREDGDVLVTYDKDFMIFQELFGNKLKILS